jgi:glucose/arabinose dehydrogenase
MDIALHPNYARNGLIYMTLSTGTESSNRTTLVRGTFDGKRVRGVKKLFQVTPDKSGGQHFGSRLLWLPDGTLLMSIGDGGNPPLRVGDRLAREQAQNLNSHLGSILRLTDTGRPAPGNPFAGRSGSRPEIWSYGHRNIQGLTRDPRTGRVWANEHGPRGGDEMNLVALGALRLPLQTLAAITVQDRRLGRQSSAAQSAQSRVDSGARAIGLRLSLAVISLQWRGSLCSGGLISEDIRRMRWTQAATSPGRTGFSTVGAFGDVKQGPDGYLYALTDEENGRLLRIVPS